MKNLEIIFEKRDAFLVKKSLRCYDVIHTDNLTRTIYKCKDAKNRYVDVSFLNKVV